MPDAEARVRVLDGGHLGLALRLTGGGWTRLDWWPAGRLLTPRPGSPAPSSDVWQALATELDASGTSRPPSLPTTTPAQRPIVLLVGLEAGALRDAALKRRSWTQGQGFNLRTRRLAPDAGEQMRRLIRTRVRSGAVHHVLVLIAGSPTVSPAEHDAWQALADDPEMLGAVSIEPAAGPGPATQAGRLATSSMTAPSHAFPVVVLPPMEEDPPTPDADDGPSPW